MRRRRPVEHRPPGSGARAAWAFTVVSLVLGVGAIAWVVGDPTQILTASRPAPAAAASASDAGRAEPTVARTEPAEDTPGVATPALASIGKGDDGGPARTTVSDDDRRRSPTPRRAPGDEAAVAPAFRIDFPSDGETVHTRLINAFGRAARDATIVCDGPDGPVGRATARADGLWVMRVELGSGGNALRFHVDGDAASLTVQVSYEPRSPTP